MFEELVKISVTVLLSLGGSGAIIIGLASWLGNIWAKTILQNEKNEHDKALEKLRADLKQKVEEELEQLKATHQSEMDLLLRKREVYQKLADSMRVFLSTTEQSNDKEKKNFLQAYALSYLWASDELINILGSFLDIMIDNTAHPDPNNQYEMKGLYVKCLLEMRRDSGFSDTNLKIDSYKFVSF